MNVEFTYAQHQGARDYQQDDAICFEHKGAQWFVICDGLGWHKDSGIAASDAVHMFREQICLDRWPEEIFSDINKTFNTRWRGFSTVQPATTITAIKFVNDTVHSFWVGDSPAFIVGKLHDDQDDEFITFTKMLAGYGHGLDNRLLYCLGAQCQDNMGYSMTENVGKIIIGSDGILPIVGSNPFVPKTANDIVEYCTNLPGSDNVTCFVVN